MTSPLPRDPRSLERYLRIAGDDSDARLGDLAVRRGLLRRPDLDRCLLLQAEDPSWRGRSVGAILVGMGWLKSDELDWLLRQQGREELLESVAPEPGGGQERRLGRFTLVQKIGEGGMGEVWRAWDTDLERWVALKLLKAVDNPEALERFRREARSAARLCHPHIVRVHESGVADGRPFIAMEYVDRRPTSARVLPVREALRITLAVAEALAYAHENGVIHRDVKPGNIYVDGDGRVFLGDFGLARPVETSPALTATGLLLGTPSYMAPEQVRGRPRDVDARTDVYGLGAAMYEWLTGAAPFGGSSGLDVVQSVLRDEPTPPRRTRPEIHRDVETICLKALEKSKAMRYPGAAEMAADVRRFLEGEPILARPLPTWRRAARFLLRRPAMAAALAVVVALCIPLAALAAKAVLDARSEREARAHSDRQRVAYAEATRLLAPARDEIDTLDLLMAREPVTVARAEPYRRRAEAAIRGALAAFPALREAYVERARLREILGDAAGAETQLNAACRLEPRDPRPFLERAKFRLRRLLGDERFTVSALFQFVAETPKETVWAAGAGGELDAAIRDVAAARRLADGPLSPAEDFLIDVLLSIRDGGDVEAADPDRLSRVLEGGIHFDQMRMLGLGLAATWRSDAVERLLGPLAALRPRDVAVRFALGMSLAVRADRFRTLGEPARGTALVEAAVEHLQAASELRVDSAAGPLAVNARVFLASAHRVAGTIDAALGRDPLPRWRLALEILEKMQAEGTAPWPVAFVEAQVCEAVGLTSTLPAPERLAMLRRAVEASGRIPSGTHRDRDFAVARLGLFIMTVQAACENDREDMAKEILTEAERWAAGIAPPLGDDPEILLRRAEVMRLACAIRGDADGISKAVELVDAAMGRIAPEDVRLLSLARAARGDLLFMQGRFEDALAEYRRIQGADPALAEAVRERIRIAEEKRRESDPTDY